MIAAPTSGSGKTIVSLALLRAFKKLGLDVSGAKAGPDFIDPMFHKLATGCPSCNLDPWAMNETTLRKLAYGQNCDLVVVEAMMGLFDGAADGSGSAADLSGYLDLPVVLVVDCSKQSHSIAALIKGFHEYRQDVDIAGIILNKIGSVRHENMLEKAISPLKIPVLGAIARDRNLELPERHLGLVQADEIAGIEGFIETASDLIRRSCDLGALEALAREIPPPLGQEAVTRPLGNNIAIANDLAFSFIYPHLLNEWRNSGCSIEFFSPLLDEAPSAACDAVFLPGGYPELHGAQLAAASNFKAGMHQAANYGATIYGECGGYMVLGQGIVDKAGERHAMLGLLDLETSFEKRQLNLGYRRARATDFPLGGVLNCHEFHYSTVVQENGQPLFGAEDALGETLGSCGLRQDNVMGSYLHVIHGECP